MKTTHEILNFYFERKKYSKPSFSFRLIARELNVSPAYVSNVFSGKKKLPMKRLKRVIELLEMDDIACLQLKATLDPEYTIPQTSLAESDKQFLKSYKTLEQCKYDILSHWYNIAILDLTTTVDFVNDVNWIARRLDIQRIEVEFALENLKRVGLLEEKDGKLIKKNKKLRLPVQTSAKLVRSYHKQMIQKALNHLEGPADTKTFEKRLIVGATIAVNAATILQAKEDAHVFLYRSAEKYSEGESDQLYQMNLQFFPLTK